MNNITKSMLVVSALLSSTCGSGPTDGEGQGNFTLNITDAPIDRAN